jgi:hypothetical protein
LGWNESTGKAAFARLYYLFMENFAADGGSVYHSDSPTPTIPFFTDRTNKGNLLWAIRPTIRPPLGDAIPELNSGGSISLVGYGGTAPRGATHEMLYKLARDGGKPVLKITLPADAPTAARYYVAVPNAVARGAAAGSKGADVHPLTTGEEKTIDTNGGEAYLFVSTLYQNVNTTVAYSWENSDIPSVPDPVESGGGGGGGCNAGFGLFGLLPLAVWVARKRMTA